MIPSPPSCGSCNDGCKRGCNSGCKDVEDGGSHRLGDYPGNGENLLENEDGGRGMFATISGSHSSPDPAPLETHSDRLHGRSTLCVSGLVANEKIEHGDSSAYPEISSVSTSIFLSWCLQPPLQPGCKRCTSTERRPPLRALWGLLQARPRRISQILPGLPDIVLPLPPRRKCYKWIHVITDLLSIWYKHFPQDSQK